MVVYVYWSSCILNVIFVRFSWNLILSKDFRQIIQYQNSWKSALWEPSCSMWTDRQTEMTKLKVVFHNFSNAPKRKQERKLHTHTHTHTPTVRFHSPSLFHCCTNHSGPRPLFIEVLRSHSGNKQHSSGLLWASEQTESETSAWQNTTLTRDKLQCHRRDWNVQSSMRAAAVRAVTGTCYQASTYHVVSKG